MIKFFSPLAASQVKDVSVKWNAPTVAPYTELPTGSNYSKIATFIPVTAGVDAYNHHPKIKSFGGVLYLAHSTHSRDEDGGGQYIRGCYSLDGITWSTPHTLMAPQSAVVDKDPVTHAYRCLTPCFWLEYNSGLYLIIDYAQDSPGEGGTGYAVLAAKMNTTTKTLETPFVVYSPFQTIPFLAGFPVFTYSAISNAILLELKKTENLITWDYTLKDALPNRVNGVLEGSGIELDNGLHLRLWRVYPASMDVKTVQKSFNKGLTFKPSEYTTIPDNPSVTIWKKLSNGKIAIMGNDTKNFDYGPNHRQNLFFGLANQDLVFDAKNVYWIEKNIQGGQLFAGARKGGGASYVDFDLHTDGYIYSTYSEYKESIYVSRFKLMEVK